MKINSRVIFNSVTIIVFFVSFTGLKKLLRTRGWATLVDGELVMEYGWRAVPEMWPVFLSGTWFGGSIIAAVMIVFFKTLMAAEYRRSIQILKDQVRASRRDASQAMSVARDNLKRRFVIVERKEDEVEKREVIANQKLIDADNYKEQTYTPLVECRKRNRELENSLEKADHRLNNAIETHKRQRTRDGKKISKLKKQQSKKIRDILFSDDDTDDQ